MAIITISRGCYSHGQEIAEELAKMLGYECISQEVLVEASRFFHVPEEKLLKSIHDSPSMLEKITHAREKFLACIQAALLEHVKEDNVVYHGYGGHMLVPGISHVLKVRVIAELEDRIALLQKKRNISRDQALKFIETEDKHRSDWNQYVCKADMTDPHLYDLVLNIGRLNVEDACEVICAAARRDTFKATPESEKAIRDLALSSFVKAALQEICEAEVSADDGKVAIHVKGQKLRKTGFTSPKLQDQVMEKIRGDLTKDILQAVRGIPGVKDVVFDIDLPYYS
ncbi:MAG: cytidylate kinase-like family protein [Deltaproteobacteria bacterium]|nr:cytidylate kinase-like family protein [Deltaproteobacteria bacterium]